MPPIKKKPAVVETVIETINETVDSNSILRLLISLNSNRPQLDFGINLNCRLIKIDNTPKIKEGEAIKRNTFLTFAKYNSKNEVIGQSEFNFFNLDPESKYILDNFVEQLSKLSILSQLLVPGSAYDPTSSFKSEEEFESALKAPKSCKALQDKMFSDFEEIVSKAVGTDGPLLALKVVTEKTGKYLQLPREDKFCALMSSDFSFLKISAYELKMKNVALQPVTTSPDTKGQAPSKEKTSVLDKL